MPSDALRDKLRVLADLHRLDLGERQLTQLACYLQLLARWNAKINLTALEIGPDSFPDASLSRLIGEPLRAAAILSRSLGTAGLAGIDRWMDIGSGSGSPAIPLKVALPSLPLAMVESRGRKASFLREAARQASLEEITVHSARVEDIKGIQVGLVSMRGVRLTESVIGAIERLLVPAGHLLVIGTDDSSLLSGRWELIESEGPVQIFQRLFHVERHS